MVVTRVSPHGVFSSELGKSAGRGRRNAKRLLDTMATSTGVAWEWKSKDALLGIEGQNITLNEDVKLKVGGGKKGEKDLAKVKRFLKDAEKQSGFAVHL